MIQCLRSPFNYIGDVCLAQHASHVEVQFRYLFHKNCNVPFTINESFMFFPGGDIHPWSPAALGAGNRLVAHPSLWSCCRRLSGRVSHLNLTFTGSGVDLSSTGDTLTVGPCWPVTQDVDVATTMRYEQFSGCILDHEGPTSVQIAMLETRVVLDLAGGGPTIAF